MATLPTSVGGTKSLRIAIRPLGPPSARTWRLVFAERIQPRASDLSVQASLDYTQRPQRLFLLKAWRTTEIGSIEAAQRPLLKDVTPEREC